MKKISLLLCVVFALFFLPGTSFSQDQDEFEYGKISVDEISQNTYEQFPDASAVILFDYGAISFELLSNNPRVKYTYQRRIKILDEAGVQKFKRMIIPYDAASNNEQIFELKASTYNLNAVGKVVEFKVNRRKIRRNKKANSQREIVIDFPLVKPGAVIEYSYEVVSKKFETLNTWVFQQQLPVIHSEFHTFIPDGYRYLRRIKGEEGNIFHERSRFNQQAINTMDLFTRSNSFGSRNLYDRRYYLNFSGVHDSYIMKYLPAVVEESFSPENTDFLPAIALELSQNFSSSLSGNNVFEDWEELASKIEKKTRLRKKSSRNEVRHMVRDFSKIRWQKEQAQRIYYYVRDNFTWNEEYEVEPKNLNQALERKRGSSAEINLLMMHMMREAGLEAWPVIISTRDKGSVQTIYPTLSQFNHLLCGVMLDGKELLLDAVGPSESFGILPKIDLNELGYLIEEDNSRWVKLRDQNKIVKVTYSRFDLDTNGQKIYGDISVSNEDYSAIIERDKFLQYVDQPEDYIREHVLIGMNNPEISGKDIQNTEESAEAPLIVNCLVTTSDYVRSVEDLVFIKPMLIKTVTNNPFVAEKRITPVDFTYPLRDSHMLGIRIPDDYEIAQLPQPIRVLLPNNGGSFTYNVLEMGNILHLTSTIYLNKTTFSPSEYESIRTFFEYIVNKHQEDIVLRKVAVNQ